MVVSSEEKWLHDVIEHVLLTELQQPIFPIKYRWFNKMKTESITLPPFLSQNIGERMCCKVGKSNKSAVCHGRGRNEGRPSPPTRHERIAVCWYLDLVGDQGERPWLPRLWPVWEWWWGRTWAVWKLARTFWKMTSSLGFWVESSVATKVVLTLGTWGCGVLWMFSVNTIKICWPD